MLKCTGIIYLKVKMGKQKKTKDKHKPNIK